MLYAGIRSSFNVHKKKYNIYFGGFNSLLYVCIKQFSEAKQ